MSWIRPLLTGVAGALIAAAVTWVYLSSITIDDGLEALMFLPILGVALVALGTIAGLRQRDKTWPALVALGSVQTTALYLIVRAIARREAALALASLTASSFIGVFALGATFAGWAFGRWVKRAQ